MKRNIVLVGYTSAGKTTVGQEVAKRLSVPFFDTDTLSAAHLGCHQDDYIKQYGSDAYRKMQYPLVVETVPTGGVVIATAGGTLLHPPTRMWLAEHGTWVYLEAPFKILYERLLRRDDRPQSKWSQEAALQRYEERLPLYKMADLRVDAAQSVASVVEQVLCALQSRVFE